MKKKYSTLYSTKNYRKKIYPITNNQPPMTTSLSQLKERIYARLPELKELSFGCRIFRKASKSEYIIADVSEEKQWVKVCTDGGGQLILDRAEYEILWHEIHTEHILRCLGERYAMCGAWYFMIIWKHWWECADIQYDLSKPIDSQSDEVVQFLLDNIA